MSWPKIRVGSKVQRYWRSNAFGGQISTYNTDIDVQYRVFIERREDMCKAILTTVEAQLVEKALDFGWYVFVNEFFLITTSPNSVDRTV